MKISDFTALGRGVQALRIAFVVIASNTAGINRYAEPFTAVATGMKSLTFEQILHHLVFETLYLFNIEKLDDILNRITVGHVKSKKTLKVFLELLVFPVLVVLVTRA